MSEINYQRLTRFNLRNVLSNLWLGPDHLLFVRSNGYSETYKRFYFRDIQAIIVRETNRRAAWNGILAPIMLGCLIGLLASLFSMPQSRVIVVIFSILSGIVLFFLLVNNLLGPGCVCYLRTAVQIEELPPLCRVPKTRRILEKIRPLITASQGGQLSSETVAARMQEWVATTSGISPAKPASSDPNIPPGQNS
jgi:hypothetical protein